MAIYNATNMWYKTIPVGNHTIQLDNQYRGVDVAVSSGELFVGNTASFATTDENVVFLPTGAKVTLPQSLTSVVYINVTKPANVQILAYNEVI